MHYKIEFEALPWESPCRGMRHKIIRQSGRLLRLVEYTKDLEAHWCEKGHIGYVLEGMIELRFESETVICGPGDGVFIPSGSEHKHMGRALSEAARIIFVEEE